jgi:hypothetical protein
MRIKLIVLLLLIAGPLVLASMSLAASSDLALPWWTLDGGGGNSQGGDYVLRSSIGQSEAGPRMSGGNYNLAGGFWYVVKVEAPIVPPAATLTVTPAETPTETPVGTPTETPVGTPDDTAGGDIYLPLVSR